MTDLVHWTAGAPLAQPWLPIAGERLLRVSDLGPFDLLDQRHEGEQAGPAIRHERRDDVTVARARPAGR